jgi:hypothetical protein
MASEDMAGEDMANVDMANVDMARAAVPKDRRPYPNETQKFRRACP